MQCPICGSTLSVEREDTGTTWFTGRYVCCRHGLIRVTGRILDDGSRKAYHYLPTCREHGFTAMTQVSDDRFLCTACDEEIRVIHGRFRRFKPVDLHSGRRALWMM